MALEDFFDASPVPVLALVKISDISASTICLKIAMKWAFF